MNGETARRECGAQLLGGLPNARKSAGYDVPIMPMAVAFLGQKVHGTLPDGVARLLDCQ
jgi:hypothetical protein